MKQSASQSDFPDLDEFLKTVEALSQVDGLLLETCSDASAFVAAREVERRFPRLPILISFTFQQTSNGLVTFTGLSPEALARLANEHPVAVLGVNCGLNIDVPSMAKIVARFRNETSLPILARPNAGTPQKIGENWVYPHQETEGVMGLIDAGANWIGGCCGTDPDWIRQVGERLRWRNESGGG